MENFNLSFPIDMIKKEERIVSGIATADNVDKSGDLVEFEASLEAFKNWGGNIREMHAPVAVGKAINYEPVEITGEDGKKYNAIKVDAYISKGAESTWEKILDGTLKAFSIGGKIIQKAESTEKMFRGRPVKLIKEYSLGELSLVDNPANALAVVDIVKMDTDGNLDYILDIIEDISFEKAKQPLKDPKGGLTAAGRRHFKQTEGANLKPGVKGPADTPEKMRRKGSFLTRFFTNPSGPMKKPNGEPTRLALSAAAWGEPVPQNMQDAAALAAKGRRLLERYENTKKKSVETDMDKREVSTEERERLAGRGAAMPDGSYPIANVQDLRNAIQSFGRAKNPTEVKAHIIRRAKALSAESELPDSWKSGGMKKQNAVTTSGMGSGIKNPEQGNRFATPTMPKKKKEKEYMDSKKFEEDTEVVKTQEESLQNDVNYDKVFNMNEQEMDKLSLIKRVINWLVPDVQENASTQVEVTENTQEEEMDIEILKEALSAVVDEKLDTFATSIKEEIEASVNEKIDTITKGFEASSAELQEKLEAAEKALAETEEQVTKFASAGAIKKSVDPEEEDEDETITKSQDKSFWGNMYLPQSVIGVLGYES